MSALDWLLLLVVAFSISAAGVGVYNIILSRRAKAGAVLKLTHDIGERFERRGETYMWDANGPVIILWLLNDPPEARVIMTTTNYGKKWLVDFANTGEKFIFTNKPRNVTTILAEALFFAALDANAKRAEAEKGFCRESLDAGAFLKPEPPKPGQVGPTGNLVPCESDDPRAVGVAILHYRIGDPEP